MPPQAHADLLHAAELWRRARRPVALTGAGISVPSGIPDFRSPGGLWSRYDPQEVASIQALHFNPLGVWEFLLDAVLIFSRARPNPAHDALAELERAGRLDGIITQNIDSLHERAGSRTVIEFHGNCRSFYCNTCRSPQSPETALALDKTGIPWLCDCGGVVRPDIVFFGETIPAGALLDSQTLAHGADLAVIVGTSGEVAPANTLPSRIKANGGAVIEVNLGPTYFEGVSDVRIDASAEEALPELAGLVLGPAPH